MKNYIILKKHNLFIFTLLILMTTCPIFGQVKMNKKATLNKTKIETKKEKSGEQMFKEILFLEGDLALNIPSVNKEMNNLKSLNSEEKKERNEFINKITSLINKKDNKFFNYFEKSISSNNPFEIQKAVTIGSNLIISSTGLTKEFKKINDFVNDEGYKYDFSKVYEIDRFKKDIVEQLNISSSMSNNGIIIITQGVNLAYNISITVNVIMFNVHFFSHGPNDPQSLEKDIFIKQIISYY